MLCVFEKNVKNPAFAKQKNSSNAKGFHLRLNHAAKLVKWFIKNNEQSVH